MSECGFEITKNTGEAVSVGATNSPSGEFVVHRGIGSREQFWVVTHVRTTYSIADFTSARNAIGFAEQVDHLDWENWKGIRAEEILPAIKYWGGDRGSGRGGPESVKL